MSARCFVDTNVLVYARGVTHPDKQARAVQWLERLWALRAGRLSVQVLQEYYVTVTSKLAPGLAVVEGRDDLRALMTWEPLAADGHVMEAAWQVQDRFRFSQGGALIVAAAWRCECRYLLTEDLEDGQDLDGMTMLGPFTNRPEEVLAS